MNAVTSAFLAACRAEIEAPKPGNVHIFSGGHEMMARDFLLSAERAAPYLGEAGASVGRRVLAGVEATLAAVGINTNLGILLLCAPLALAYERALVSQAAKETLRRSLLSVLDSMEATDSKDVFEAIRRASPGGMGRADKYDLSGEPQVPLRPIMAAAAERDRIARAYADGYLDVFGPGLEALAATRSIAAPPWWPATAVYLAFLSAHPDTHIIRKWGMDEARWVQTEAISLLTRLDSNNPALPALLEFDRAIKVRGLNPGTSADFTVATLFCERLINILRQGAESG